MPDNSSPLDSIPETDLAGVSGGASRVSSRSSGGSDQLTLMMTQITNSIKELATNKNQSDPSMMMMMVMMMMGNGGSSGGAVAAAPPPPPPPPAAPVVNISTNVRSV